VRLGHNLKPDAPALSELMTRYDAELARHHLTNWWPGGSGNVAVKIDEGTLTVDWSAYDKAMEAAPRGLIFCPMWYPRPLRTTEQWTADDEKLLGDYLAQLEAHFRQKSWLTRARLMPVARSLGERWSRDRFEQIAHIASQRAKGLRIIALDDYDPAVARLVDTWAVTFDQVMRLEKLTPGFFEQRRAKGDLDLWSLNVAWTRPDAAPAMYIDLPASYHRIWPWMTWRLGLAGLIGRDVAVYSTPSRAPVWDDPVAIVHGARRPAGEGRLFYPGTPDRIGGTTHLPLPSLRLKCLRDGIEDYAYLELLRTLGPEGRQAAAAQATALVSLDKQPPAYRAPRTITAPDWPECCWEADPSAPLKARKALADEILRLSPRANPAR
jgi:hypothetical protein